MGCITSMVARVLAPFADGNATKFGAANDGHSHLPVVTRVEAAPRPRVRRPMCHSMPIQAAVTAVGVLVEEMACSSVDAENAAGVTWVAARPRANVGTVAVAVRAPSSRSRADEVLSPSFWKNPAGMVMAGQPAVIVAADAAGTLV